MGPDLNASYYQLNQAIAPNNAGLAVGYLFIIPFTKKYGRRTTYILSTATMAAVSLWTARMDTVAELYITNLLYGLAGSTNETIVQITVSVLF